MTKRTLEQLRSQVWLSQADGAKELKRNGYAARGDDYELREASPGSWQIAEFDPTDSQSPPATKAAAPNVNGKKPPTPKPPKPQSQTKAPAKTPAAKAKPAVVAPPAGENEKHDDSLPEQQPQSAVPKPEAPPVGTDLSSLPTNGGPYTLGVQATHVMQSAAVTQALTLSKALGVPCAVAGPDGVVLRIVDYVAVMAAKRAAGKRSGGGAVAPRKRDPNAQPNPMTAAAIKLARRPEGVTREQLRAVSPKQQPWTAIIKEAADRWGYVYRTSDAPADSKSRTVYHLDTKPE
jgi:hypothetical protein